jgi:long-chain acyl-CoA synthetase
MNGSSDSFNRSLLEAFDNFGLRSCFKVKRGFGYRDYNYTQIQGFVFRIAFFLQSLRLGKGERIAIVAENSPEWMAIFIAALFSDCVAVPLSTSLPADMLRLILRDSGATIAVIQDERFYNEIRTRDGELPDLKTVIVFNESVESMSEVISLNSILEQSIAQKDAAEIRKFAERIDPNDFALIFYTAKETDKPVGAAFDHFQMHTSLENMSKWLNFEEDDIAFTLLNWGNPISLKVSLHYFLSGVNNSLAEGSDTVFENLQETSPTVVITIPFALENIYNKVTTEFSQFHDSRQSIFLWALATSKEYQAAGLTASNELRERYKRADMTFFSQIRGMLGGRLRRIFLAGANLSEELVDFAQAIGLKTFNLYHVTESGGFPAVCASDVDRPETCGQVAPGFQIRIADDSEVLIRGDTVMRQYWEKPEETSQTIDPDGWLHTGDLGRFDSDGFLYLTGYKQSVIKLSKGLKIMPDKVENALTSSPFVYQAVVIGEARPYASALIVPKYEALAAHLREHGDGDVGMLNMYHPSVNTLLDKVVADVNIKLDPWERIEAYTLIDQPFSREKGELSQSMKLNRNVIAERYSVHIQAMYPMAIRLEDSAVTQVQLEPEHLRELLEKQDILNAWIKDAGIGFLFELARAKDIDITSMVHICDTVSAIAQMQSEEKPLSTALIVGEPSRVSHVLPESEIQLQRYDHIRRMRQVVITLAKVVDGVLFAYGVDKHGYVRKIHKLDRKLDHPASFLLGPQFSYHAAVSEKCDAVVFFVPTGGRQVRVFANGQLVGRYTDGNWYSESTPYLEESVARLAEEKQIDLKLLTRILRCAFQMSEENLGAIIVLGDSEVILKRSDPPGIAAFATLLSTPMEKVSDRVLINFAKQDGATIIDTSQGLFRACMVLLRPEANTKADVGVGKGARHSSAAKMSAEANCLAITVSQDGPITLYDGGKRILSL